MKIIIKHIIFIIFAVLIPSNITCNNAIDKHCLAPISQSKFYDEIVVLNVKNNEYQVLQVISGDKIRNYTDRIKAARSLNRWLKNVSVHVHSIQYLVQLLEDNESKLLENVYFVISDDYEIEGWIHNFIDDAWIMEIAPWNREKNSHTQKFKGVGAAFRYSFLKIMQIELGAQFYSSRNIKRIEVLGHREKKPNLFDVATIDRNLIDVYMNKQEKVQRLYCQIYRSN